MIINNSEENFNDYNLSKDEINEIEEILKDTKEKSIVKNRLIKTFKTESHWIGWLKVHGIRWN
jgi:hypothetical protein